MGFFGDIIDGIKDVVGIGSSVASQFSGGRSADDAFDMNAALQKEFAQNGVQWKVRDAKAAGVHPLYALGAPPTSFSPIGLFGDSGTAEHLATMGQDVSRAAVAGSSQRSRVSGAVDALQLENMGLQNDLLRSQIARLNSGQVGPPSPPGAESAFASALHPLVDVQPLQPNATDPRSPEKEVGHVSDYTFAKTPTGLAIVPSVDVKQRIEDNFIPEIFWSLRNNLMPNIDSSRHLPDQNLYPTEPGKKWMWDYWNQEFRQVPIGSWYKGRVPER